MTKTTFQGAGQSFELKFKVAFYLSLIVFFKLTGHSNFYEEDKIDKSTFINYSKAEVFDSDKHISLFSGLKLTDYYFLLL
jgi:hypothetical protein